MMDKKQKEALSKIEPGLDTFIATAVMEWKTVEIPSIEIGKTEKIWADKEGNYAFGHQIWQPSRRLEQAFMAINAARKKWYICLQASQDWEVNVDTGVAFEREEVTVCGDILPLTICRALALAALQVIESENEK